MSLLLTYTQFWVFNFKLFNHTFLSPWIVKQNKNKNKILLLINCLNL